ncbi:MAG TPA: hypothetical protein VG733_13430 [Chthoniobacteraceae bacterium]|nr:hypothetical protein [Chthoniobacteraceae bacterium]
MPMELSPSQFEALLPLACAWAEEQEAVILSLGVALAAGQLEDVAITGVKHPEKVRLLRVDRIPGPTHPVLAEAGRLTGLVSSGTAGLTLRNGIFIRSDCWGDRRLLVHEMVHVGQYERLGGIEPFLRQYLWECITVGYSASPLEQEAVRVAAATRL